jgi:hypothetical protein
MIVQMMASTREAKRRRPPQDLPQRLMVIKKNHNLLNHRVRSLLPRAEKGRKRSSKIVMTRSQH